MELQLKRIREIRGLKQQDMADALQIKKRTYGSWERGEVSLSFPQAIACAEILGCSTDELAGREVPAREYADERQARINENFLRVNDAGKARMATDSDEIADMAKYRKDQPGREPNPLPQAV